MTTRSGPAHGRPDHRLSAIISERRQLINPGSLRASAARPPHVHQRRLRIQSCYQESAGHAPGTS
jgi:hypothetical protein